MGNSDSRAQFRGQLEVLVDRPVEAKDTEFWTDLWKLPGSAQDVFQSLQPADVRKLLTDQPKNLEALLGSAMSRLRELAEDPSPVAIPHALNAMRVLTRCIPVLLEDVSEDEGTSANELLWGSPKGEETKGQPDNGEPFARRLVRLMGELLFTEGFTVSVEAGTEARRAVLEARQGGGGVSDAAAAEVAATGAVPVRTAQLWAPGIGGLDIRPVGGSGFELHRSECLRLLLVCVSSTIYGTQKEYSAERQRWLRELCSPDFPHHAELFCSLLNTTLTYDAVGWGVPYAETLLGADDTKLNYVHNAAHLALILLDFDLRIARLPDGVVGAGVMVPPSINFDETENVHRATLGLAGRTQPKQLDWMIDSILRLHVRLHARPLWDPAFFFLLSTRILAGVA